MSFAVTCGSVEHAVECSREDVAKSFSCKCLSAGKTTRTFERKQPLPGSPDSVAEKIKPQMLTIMNNACGWKLE